jgi:GT2 family glycosyltransferase
MISGHDIIYSPGDIARLVEHMETVGGVGLLSGFSAFGIDRTAVTKAGLFDENFHPAYFEDNDYDYRCRLTGVELHALPSGMQHRNSSTIRDSEEYRIANHRTFPSNRDYFLAKWGGGAYKEVFTTPFDKGGDPRDWYLDIDRVARQAW